MSISSHQKWLAESSMGVLKPRSSALKAVDDALLQYERTRTQQDLWKLKNAFESWKRAKEDWKASGRDRTGAITRLEEELNRVADYRTNQLAGGRFTMQELQALQFVAQQRKQVIANVFRGKQVVFRASPTKLKDAAVESAEKVKQTSEAAKRWLEGNRKPSPLSTGDIVRAKMEAMVKSLFSVDSLESIGSLSSLVISIVGKCGVSITPVVGHIKDGYDLFTGWAKAGAALYEQCSISECKYVIDMGAPAAAFAALKRSLKDETKNEVAAATTATTSFALKTGLAFVDGGAVSGPVVGAVAALADCTRQLYWLATEYKATKAINTALTAGNLDMRLFKTYPLMGSYMLVSATLSDLIPIDCFGTPGWMDYIESLKKHGFDDVYTAATGLIDKSPWEIEGLPKRPVKGAGPNLGALSGPLSSLSGPAKDLYDWTKTKV